MRSAIVIIAVLVVLLGGTAMGIASLLLLPLVGAFVLIALLIWFLKRRSEGRPPIP